MSDKKGLYWLASYPKSGNTWFRIVLANVLNKTNNRINLNEINTGAIASSRGFVDNALGLFDSAVLDHDELDQLLPFVYSYHHEHAHPVRYHKIHNAYMYLDKKKSKPLFPAEACLGAIYIIRNPLDVAISYANHSNCSIDNAIDCLEHPDLTYGNGIFGIKEQIRHFLGSWSFHVESWTSAPNLNILTIRYEDMKAFPFDTFSKAMAFLKIDVTEKDLNIAIEEARFEKLQSLEEKTEFREKPVKVERFFRKGIVGDWQATLTSGQIKRIVSSHAVVMQKHGYLDESLIEYF